MYKALLVTEENGIFKRQIIHKEIKDLLGEVLINVKYSSLNYKDMLSSFGNKGVTRHYPHTPGIDAAGTIVDTNEEVIVTGFDLGMNTSGGYQEYIKVPKDWIIKLPQGLGIRESMMLGTAGFTSALSVDKLISSGLKPNNGEILVTGATGGVGIISVMILGQLGYRVVAATGKMAYEERLLQIGASRVINRDEVNDLSKKPLLRPRWAGVIDTVGGNILSTAIKSTEYNGHVTTCGNISSQEFTSSVYPFILNGITLHGIDSVKCPINKRQEIWDKLGSVWKPKHLDFITTEISLDQIEEKLIEISKGMIFGRILVKI